MEFSEITEAIFESFSNLPVNKGVVFKLPKTKVSILVLCAYLLQNTIFVHILDFKNFLRIKSVIFFGSNT